MMKYQSFVKALFIGVTLFFVNAHAQDEGPDESRGHFHECDDPLKEFVQCQSTGCIKTCANPNPIQCTLDCAHGCFCRDGYVLDQTTERCVMLDQCTSLCRQNEEYRECERCEATCHQGPVCPPGCTEKGRGFCVCQKGFVRNYIGQCVERHDCHRFN